MGLFEFIMVLLSIIVGLGIAELLTGVANTLQNRHTVRVYWVHAALTAAIFLALVQQFWEAWGLRYVDVWGFGAMLQMLAAPICLYLCARLLFPDPIKDCDLEVHYYDTMRPVWVLLGIGTLVSTTFRTLAFDAPLLVAENLTSLIILIGVAALWVVQHRAVHAFAVSLALILVIGDIAVWTGAIAS